MLAKALAQAAVTVAKDSLHDRQEQGLHRFEPRLKPKSIFDRARLIAQRLNRALVLPEAHQGHLGAFKEAMAFLELHQANVVVLDRDQPKHEQPAAKQTLTQLDLRLRQLLDVGREGHRE